MNVQVGDKVKIVYGGRNLYGIIRHIGILQYCGEKDSLWANWNFNEREVDKGELEKLVTASNGGNLTYPGGSYKLEILKKKEIEVYNIVKFMRGQL